MAGYNAFFILILLVRTSKICYLSKTNMNMTNFMANNLINRRI